MGHTDRASTLGSMEDTALIINIIDNNNNQNDFNDDSINYK